MHHQLTAAGARVVGVSVDGVRANAAMVAKLRLPFPLLSDPGGERAIKPYDVWHADAQIARPATVVVDPAGQQVFRRVGGDFADRPAEEEVVERVRALRLPATEQPPPAPGDPRPGERAVDPAWLPAYLRGAKFAATAVGMRVPAAKEQVDALTGEYERYLAALQQWKEQGDG